MNVGVAQTSGLDDRKMLLEQVSFLLFSLLFAFSLSLLLITLFPERRLSFYFTRSLLIRRSETFLKTHSSNSSGTIFNILLSLSSVKQSIAPLMEVVTTSSTLASVLLENASLPHCLSRCRLLPNSKTDSLLASMVNSLRSFSRSSTRDASTTS